MKNSLKTLLMMSALAVLPTIAMADSVDIIFSAGNLCLDSTSQLLPAGRTVVILVDKDNDKITNFGFSTSTITDRTWTPDSDDQVLARFATSEPGKASTELYFDIFEVGEEEEDTVVSTGDRLFMVWYDTPFDPSPTALPGPGVKFGIYRASTVINGSDIAFTVPAYGNYSLTVQSYGNGTTPASSLVTTLVTPGTPVPEPASLAILGMGGMLLALRRRRA